MMKSMQRPNLRPKRTNKFAKLKLMIDTRIMTNEGIRQRMRGHTNHLMYQDKPSSPNPSLQSMMNQDLEQCLSPNLFDFKRKTLKTSRNTPVVSFK